MSHNVAGIRMQPQDLSPPFLPHWLHVCSPNSLQVEGTCGRTDSSGLILNPQRVVTKENSAGKPQFITNRSEHSLLSSKFQCELFSSSLSTSSLWYPPQFPSPHRCPSPPSSSSHLLGSLGWRKQIKEKSGTKGSRDYL